MLEIAEIQRNYFAKGSTRDVGGRISHLQKLKQLIIKYEADILSAVRKDLGRCFIEISFGDTGLVISEIDFMLKNIENLVRAKKVKTPLMFMGGSSFIVPEPYGTVLIIAPWNYPFQLAMVPLVGAIAAGNCVVLKPSELSSNTSSIMTKIINDNFAPEFITSVEGGIETSQQLLSQNFDYIFYTGSTPVGKIVMEAAAKNLTPVTLELGGKSPCIVDADTHLENAARRIAWGKFIASGQTCMAPDYILVHKKIKDDFIRTFIATIKEFFGQDPINCEEYSGIINEKRFDRLLSLIRDENILYGGESSREKLRISPTIVHPVAEDSMIMQEEIFGPIMPILEFNDLSQAIAYINSKTKPLAVYLFSNNKTNIDRIIRETSSGAVAVNDTVDQVLSHYLPFGGVGDSGMGSYHGPASFDTFSHSKSVLKNQIVFDVKVKYPPYKISTVSLKKMLKYSLK